MSNINEQECYTQKVTMKQEGILARHCCLLMACSWGLFSVRWVDDALEEALNVH